MAGTPVTKGKRLKAGIIGLGVGEAHIEGYLNREGCQVVALCDFDKAKRSYLKSKYPAVRILGDADKFLSDPEIDVVSVASFDNYHYEQIVKALSHDKHVFVEKPLCLNEVEARHIRQLLREKPHLRLSSNLILRKSPRFIRARELARTGSLGTLFHVEGDYMYGRLHKLTDGWRGSIPFYSIVYGGALHMVDLLLWLTGDTIQEVAAYGNDLPSRGTQFKHYSMVVAILRFASGMTGKVSANFGCVHPHFHALSLFGDKGTFVNGRENGLLFESRLADDQPALVQEEYPGVPKGALVSGFVDSILSGSQPEVSAEDVFRSMSVCFAIEKASHSGSTVAVDYL